MKPDHGELVFLFEIIEKSFESMVTPLCESPEIDLSSFIFSQEGNLASSF